MKRTLKGFLGSYCRELSGLETSSLKKLCTAAVDNPRVAEPLMLLAMASGKERYLLGLARGTWMEGGYREVLELCEGHSDVESFLRSGSAPGRYESVIDAYDSQGDGLAADKRICALIRPRVLAGLAGRRVTRYRLAADLGLNPGNVYAYLAGDDSKVSRSTAERMLAYATAR